MFASVFTLHNIPKAEQIKVLKKTKERHRKDKIVQKEKAPLENFSTYSGFASFTTDTLLLTWLQQTVPDACSSMYRMDSLFCSELIQLITYVPLT